MRQERGIRIIDIPKDSVVYRPHVIYKDTTIVVENKQVLLKTKYLQGKIIKVVCEQKPQHITETYEKKEAVNIKEKDKQRNGFVWRDVYLLWSGLFILVLMIVQKLLNKLL